MAEPLQDVFALAAQASDAEAIAAAFNRYATVLRTHPEAAISTHVLAHNLQEVANAYTDVAESSLVKAGLLEQKDPS